MDEICLWISSLFLAKLIISDTYMTPKILEFSRALLKRFDFWGPSAAARSPYSYTWCLWCTVPWCRNCPQIPCLKHSASGAQLGVGGGRFQWAVSAILNLLKSWNSPSSNPLSFPNFLDIIWVIVSNISNISNIRLWRRVQSSQPSRTSPSSLPMRHWDSETTRWTDSTGLFTRGASRSPHVACNISDGPVNKYVSPELIKWQ